MNNETQTAGKTATHLLGVETEPMKVRVDQLYLLVWDGKVGKHRKVILNPACKQGKDEFYVFATQEVGFLEADDLQAETRNGYRRNEETECGSDYPSSFESIAASAEAESIDMMRRAEQEDEEDYASEQNAIEAAEERTRQSNLQHLEVTYE